MGNCHVPSESQPEATTRSGFVFKDEYDTHPNSQSEEGFGKEDGEHNDRFPINRRKLLGRSTFRSLFRVGSKILKPAETREPDGTKATTLVSARAYTYDHVHDAVLTTFKGHDVLERQAGIVGLRNMGNTCFMNTSLQCLSNTIPLTDYFLGYQYQNEINKDNFLGTGGEMVTSYAKLMKSMWLGTDRSLEPYDFKKKIEKFAPQFRGRNQHDSQELLAFLLDGIHEDLNRVKKKPYIEDKDCDGTNDTNDSMVAWKNYLCRNKSIVVDLFQGQLRNTMICQNQAKHRPDGSAGCGHKNVKFEPFMYLSLPISEKCETLEDCLELFCTKENLTGDDQWYCPKCKKHVNASKKFDIWMLPPILIIHLKRFKYSDWGTRSKINQSIRYPLQSWDLSNFVKSAKGNLMTFYDLYAVANHKGGLGGGHYTAYCMNRFNDAWYEFNDSFCTVIEPRDLGHSPSAYCLFYNRTEQTVDGLRRTAPLIRRQSIDRPDLWPHMQMTKDYRGFQRSIQNLDINLDDIMNGDDDDPIKPQKMSAEKDSGR